ncbi:MAG: hypothetical protein ACN4GW_05810 [Desulforhopalus sp.]
MKEIACFISPHGYGHATRAIAVLESLKKLEPNLRIHIFTTVPRTLFTESLAGFTYHPVQTDVGLVQSSALVSDIPATLQRLEECIPYPRPLIDRLASLCSECSLILCDIAPLGITIAKKLGIPSVLVENFTWDWIYHSYCTKYPQLKRFEDFFRQLFERVDYHIQTEPLCRPSPNEFSCGPIFRQKRGTEGVIRRQLGCADKKLILITMGGVFEKFKELTPLDGTDDHLFVYSGQDEHRLVNKNTMLLDRRGDIYHPDLVGAADLVVCKAGYSTVAECFQAGVRVICVGRSDFAESAPLMNYVTSRLDGVAISQQCYENGEWLSLVPQLLRGKKPEPAGENGADRVGKFLYTLLH